jgi:hypothetical protein
MYRAWRDTTQVAPRPKPTTGSGLAHVELWVYGVVLLPVTGYPWEERLTPAAQQRLSCIRSSSTFGKRR